MPDFPELSTPEASSHAEDEVELLSSSTAPTLRNIDSSDVQIVEVDPFLVTSLPFNNEEAVVPPPLFFDGDEVSNVDGKSTVLPSFAVDIADVGVVIAA